MGVYMLLLWVVACFIWLPCFAYYGVKLAELEQYNQSNLTYVQKEARQFDEDSGSRIITLNSIDDFCLFGPPYFGSVGETESEAVSFCIKSQNGARQIPPWSIRGAHIVRTPRYIQITGTGDMSGINVDPQDPGGGGELDSHGEHDTGNPIGGRAKTIWPNGLSEEYYSEWIEFLGPDEFCLRICWDQEDISAAVQCNHIYDLMGCGWVIPGDYSEGFSECEGEPALPPGWYPQSDGSISIFQQRYTGTATWYENGYEMKTLYTIGELETPALPASTPNTYNCRYLSNPFM